MQRSSRFSRSMAPVLGAVLAVSACGGSDSSGASIEDWCSFAAEAEEVDEIFASLATGGGDIEAGMLRVRELAERLPKVAPSEVKDDAKDLSDGALTVVKALEDADFSLLDADLSVLADPELDARNTAANERLDEFTQAECGRAFGTDDANDDDPTSGGEAPAGEPADEPADDAFDPADGTLREQLVAQFESIGLTNAEATCIANELDFNDPAVQSGDIASMLEFFSACGISLDRLAELGQG